MKIRRAAVFGTVVLGALMAVSAGPAVADLSRPGYGQSPPRGRTGPIPSETTEPVLQAGASSSGRSSDTTAGTGSAGSAALAVAHAGASTAQKSTETSSPTERLNAEPADERSPLSKIPWGPALLGVAFFVVVRRLARLT